MMFLGVGQHKLCRSLRQQYTECLSKFLHISLDSVHIRREIRVSIDSLLSAQYYFSAKTYTQCAEGQT